jgi:hypothetical protein
LTRLRLTQNARGCCERIRLALQSVARAILLLAPLAAVADDAAGRADESRGGGINRGAAAQIPAARVARVGRCVVRTGVRAECREAVHHSLRAIPSPRHLPAFAALAAAMIHGEGELLVSAEWALGEIRASAGRRLRLRWRRLLGGIRRRSNEHGCRKRSDRVGRWGRRRRERRGRGNRGDRAGGWRGWWARGGRGGAGGSRGVGRRDRCCMPGRGARCADGAEAMLLDLSSGEDAARSGTLARCTHTRGGGGLLRGGVVRHQRRCVGNRRSGMGRRRFQSALCRAG